MMEALQEQKEIHKRFGSGYFFCSPEGCRVDTTNLASRVWFPALDKAGLERREMKQTRHSFATVALACGENPLWVAKLMGHHNAEMIINVYGKYMANTLGTNDGSALAKAREKAFGMDE